MCPLLKTYAKTENKVQNRKVTRKSAVPSQKDGKWYFLPIIIQKIACWGICTNTTLASFIANTRVSPPQINNYVAIMTGPPVQKTEVYCMYYEIIYNIIVLNPYY